MSEELDESIRRKVQWIQLPTHLKRLLGDSQQKYEQYVYEFSLKNQLRFKGSLVRHYRNNEKKYYETLVQTSIQRLMLFPYHLADMVVKGLRVTPFTYYKEVVAVLIEREKSYDTMPNFTAADCLRLLGIGRNEYLDLVSKSRSLGKRNRSKCIRELLPRIPIDIPMLPWWRVELGCVLDIDVKSLSSEEVAIIDLLIDCGSQTAGSLNYDIVKSLYRRGLIYLDVPVTAVDRVAVPPLKGFVMNRTAGDYFETLLYRIFVSIDQHTTVGELASVLQVDVENVKQAVSLYCRLGFAKKLNPAPVTSPSRTWDDAILEHNPPPYHQIPSINELDSKSAIGNTPENTAIRELKRENTPDYSSDGIEDTEHSGANRVAFLFDATLAAYLMMGNLSPDLKSHAVTLFEVGKLCDESLDGLMQELDKVGGESLEGEAWRYLCAARCVRICLATLRPTLRPIDLLRAESLLALPTQARLRLLNSKYRLAISVAPLTVSAAAGARIAQLAPSHPLLSEPWFRLYLYHVAGYGPPTLFLTKGTTLRAVPRALLGYGRLCACGAAAGALPAATALDAARQTLQRRAAMLHAAAVRATVPHRYLVFPPPDPALRPLTASEREDYQLWMSHAGLRRLVRRLRLHRCCGYVTLADLGLPDFGCGDPPDDVQLVPSKKKLPGMAMAIKDLTHDRTNIENSPKQTKDSLISPNESHFAVTPNKESKSNSPSNGFTSSDCGDILREELEKIASEECETIESEEKDCENESEAKQSETLVGSYEKLNSSEAKSETSFENIAENELCGKSLENLIEDASKSSEVRSESEVKSEVRSETEVKSEDRTKVPSDLFSPMDESISMFTKLEEKLSEVSIVAEGDSGVDVATDEDTCKPEQWTILDLHFGVPLFDEALCARVCESIVERLITPENLEQLKKDNEYLSEDLTRFVTQCQYYPGEARRPNHLPLAPRRSLVFENGRITEWNGK